MNGNKLAQNYQKSFRKDYKFKKCKKSLQAFGINLSEKTAYFITCFDKIETGHFFNVESTVENEK